MTDDSGLDLTSGGDTTPKAVGIGEICNLALLKSVWNRSVRKQLRGNKLNDFNLATDALQFIAYDWDLRPLFDGLMHDLQAGEYIPEWSETIWSAKKVGLSRPLAFLEPRDALVYRTLIHFAENDLLRENQEWTEYRRHLKDGKKNEELESTGDYPIDFMALWLARQGKLAEIADNYPFIVESDIANFFPTIELSSVSDMLLKRTRLSQTAVRLLVHILKHVQPRMLYSSVPDRGIPQENIGASRVLGHTLLYGVDAEFQTEGTEGRYSRFMDDIVIGVSSEDEGLKIVSRFQIALHRLGLYPNISKTRVVTADKFLRDLMINTNGELDSIEHDLRQLEVGDLHIIPSVPDEITERLATLRLSHLQIPQNARPKAWEQVLRRIYTAHRRAGDPGLLDFVSDHIWTIPAGARSFLEYVRSFPLESSLVGELVQLLQRSRHLYEDLPLLICETIATAPVSSSEVLWKETAQRFVDLTISELPNIGDSYSSRLASRIATASIVVVGKYGHASHLSELHENIWPSLPADSTCRLQSVPILLGAGLMDFDLLRSDLPRLSWRSGLNLDFLKALGSGDERALGIGISLLRPERRLLPLRWICHVRGTLLVPMFQKVGKAKWEKASASSLRRLSANPERLRDYRTERIISI